MYIHPTVIVPTHYYYYYYYYYYYRLPHQFLYREDEGSRWI